MTGNCRPVLLFLLALLCCRASLAQLEPPTLPPGMTIEPLEAEAKRLLASSDLRDRSWGAYLAGRFGLKDLVPEVLAVLDPSWPFGASGERDFFVHAALDSLIQLKANPPSEILLPLYEQAPDAVVILLAGEPEENQAALLSLAEKPASYFRWLALSNLLAQTKAPGFAALVLRELRITVNVTVSDGQIGGGVGSSFGTGGGCGFAQFRPGYPPIGTYKLTTQAERGFSVLAPGRRIVYAQRRITYPAGDSGPFDADPVGGLRDEERMHYLASLLGTSVESLPLQQRSFHSIVYRGTDAFLSEVDAVLQHVRAGHAALVAQLSARGLLSGHEAAASCPDLRVAINDLRADRSSALPAVPGVEAGTF